MEPDPEIEVFDVSAHTHLEFWAADSASRMAPMLRAWADAAETEQQRANYLREAEMHEEFARACRRADRVMAEVKQALEEEGACLSL
jgi:hypothetical protein